MGTRKNFSNYPQPEHAFSKKFDSPGSLEFCSMLDSVFEHACQIRMPRVLGGITQGRALSSRERERERVCVCVCLSVCV